MRVLIRADASSDIGGGHVSRCLALAEAMRAQGGRVRFVCRALPGDMREAIGRRGFEVITLPLSGDEDDARASLAPDAGGERWDWAVLDHYGLGSSWERAARACGARVLAIDDLPVREHDCDVLLDPNYSAEGEMRWRKWVPAGSRVWTGTRYLLLRSGFFDARRALKTRDGKVRRILVSMGAADAPGAGCVVLRALLALADRGRLAGVAVDVVAGAGNPHAEALEHLARQLPDSSFSPHSDAMAELIAGADLGIGAGGISVWERCYLGLPSCAVAIADNQRESVERLDRMGVHVSLGWHAELEPGKLAGTIGALMNDPDGLKCMSERGRALVGEPDFVRRPLDYLV